MGGASEHDHRGPDQHEAAEFALDLVGRERGFGDHAGQEGERPDERDRREREERGRRESFPTRCRRTAPPRRP